MTSAEIAALLREVADRVERDSANEIARLGRQNDELCDDVAELRERCAQLESELADLRRKGAA